MDKELNRRVRALCRLCDQADSPGVLEAVPTYRSALIYYDPLVKNWDDMVSLVRKLLESLTDSPEQAERVVCIPTCYGGELGPDLSFVAEHTKLSPGDVVSIHSAPLYLVYMIGFTAGYPYMGGLDPRLSVPRLGTPRLSTPAGSVGLAGSQTGIYSLETPGGWRIIGRTPVRLFDPVVENPFIFEAGDLIKFEPIDRGEYDRILSLVEKRQYEVRTYDAATII